MSAQSLMIQGTGSSVGKSLVVTALCRIFARKGLSVAPFKSQNMSLNSFTTDEGLEMGRAQVAQAEAAGLAPSALMNPVLLKPCGERTSQLIVHGKVRETIDAMAYHQHKAGLAHEVRTAYETLAARHELILIEGAGSPAEINLRDNDIANMGMAGIANAPVILTADIDRGGVFASLYGTVKLLEVDEQERIRGLIINKFRGDMAILEPGLRQIEYILAKPVVGVLPWLDVHVDEEDSLTDRLRPNMKRDPAALDVAVIRLPRMANFTDFAVFDLFEGLALRFVESTRQLGAPDLVILPGTKNTQADLRFLHDSGLAEAVRKANAAGVPLIGICGGYQMLGQSISDPLGAESGHEQTPGLGLLPLHTVFAQEKRTCPASLRVCDSPARLLAGTAHTPLTGYEIHMGQKAPGSAPLPDEARPFARYPDGSAEGMVLQGNDGAGDVLGTYLHGLFDDIAFTRTLLSNVCALVGKKPLPESAQLCGIPNYAAFRLREYDRLADIVEAHLDMPTLERIIARGV